MADVAPAASERKDSQSSSRNSRRKVERSQLRFEDARPRRVRAAPGRTFSSVVSEIRFELRTAEIVRLCISPSFRRSDDALLNVATYGALVFGTPYALVLFRSV